MDADPRFQRFSTDPKFRKVPRKVRKVAIDSRFKAMFGGDNRAFSETKAKVDKRGRPIKFNAKENFRRYYNIDGTV